VARGECEVGGPVNGGGLKDVAAPPSSNPLSNGGLEEEDQGFTPAGGQDCAASLGSCTGTRDQALTTDAKEKPAGVVRPGTAPAVGLQGLPDLSGSAVGSKSPPSAQQQVRGTHDSTSMSNASLPKASAGGGRDAPTADPEDVELSPPRVPPAENGISSEPTSAAAGTQGSRGDHELSTAAGIQGPDNPCLAKPVAPVAARSHVHADDGVIAPWEWARPKGAACVSAYTDDFSGGALLLKATHEAAKQQSQVLPQLTRPTGKPTFTPIWGGGGGGEEILHGRPASRKRSNLVLGVSLRICSMILTFLVTHHSKY
jgi:hypothetical protein